MLFSDNSSFKEKEKEIKNFSNIKLLLKEKINKIKILIQITMKFLI